MCSRSRYECIKYQHGMTFRYEYVGLRIWVYGYMTVWLYGDMAIW